MKGDAPDPLQDPFVSLADPTRRRILELLRAHGVRLAGEISNAFPEISRPAVSRHLRLLRESRLVVVERAGREQRYRLNLDAIARLQRDWFRQFVPLLDASLSSLKGHVELAAKKRAHRKRA